MLFVFCPDVHTLAAMVTAGVRTASASFDDAFWVSYWGQPKIILNGSEEEAFYRGLKEVVFARNVCDQCENPSVLDDDARWLKEIVTPMGEGLAHLFRLLRDSSRPRVPYQLGPCATSCRTLATMENNPS